MKKLDMHNVILILLLVCYICLNHISTGIRDLYIFYIFIHGFGK